MVLHHLTLWPGSPLGHVNKLSALTCVRVGLGFCRVIKKEEVEGKRKRKGTRHPHYVTARITRSRCSRRIRFPAHARYECLSVLSPCNSGILSVCSVVSGINTFHATWGVSDELSVQAGWYCDSLGRVIFSFIFVKLIFRKINLLLCCIMHFTLYISMIIMIFLLF